MTDHSFQRFRGTEGYVASRGGGIGEFAEVHGGPSPEATNGCYTCHTQVPSTPTQWPHQYKWNSR